MSSRHVLKIAVWLMFMSAGSSAAQDALSDTATLHGNAFTNARGAVSVNAAAGNNNQQANIAVIGNGRVAIASAALVQTHDTVSEARDRIFSAGIEDGAFANASGLIAVNVVAGGDNQQGNLAVISTGLVGNVATDAILSQSQASVSRLQSDTDSATVATAQTDLGEGTFENSSGIVQLSIIGGERNASSNLFALSVSGGAEP